MLSCGCSMDDYLELYTKHRDKLMSYPEFKGATGYDRNTYGTWEIAMQKIEKIAAEDTGEQSLAAHNAIKLFRMFAFLDHADIPQELFKNAAENYMESNIDKETMTPGLPLIVKLLNHETLFLNEEGGWNIIEFLSGIQVLLSFSLIKSHNQLYSMHLLVHAWSRSRLPKAEIADLYHRTRAVLSCSIVLDYNIDNYTFCRLLVRHIRSNSLHAMELQLQGTFKFYDDEYERFSLVFDHVGDWDEREKLFVVQVNQRKAKLGSDHTHTLFSMGHLASTYRSQGRWDKAEKLQIELMNATQAKLGSDHPHTLASIGNLALTYQVQGRWDEAEKLQIEVMNARQVKLGSDHPHTLIVMGDLAVTYKTQGRLGEAEKLEVEVMDKAKLGSDCQLTLTAMNNLALTYESQRRWDEGEKLLIQVIHTEQAKFASNHPDTLTSMANLALIYGGQRRSDEAHSLLSHAVKMMQQVMGPQHPDTLYYQKQLDNLSKELSVCHHISTACI